MVGTIADMGTLVWLALAFFVVVLAVGPWFAFHHGLRTFRASMRTLERLGDELETAAAKLRGGGAPPRRGCRRR